MLALRYVYVLALAVWLGGMVVLGAVVAPTTFQVLQASEPASGRLLGGAVFGAILSRFHYVAYGAGTLALLTLAAMALLGPRPRGFAVRSSIVGLMLVVALVLRLRRTARSRRDPAGGRRSPIEPARRRREARAI